MTTSASSAFAVTSIPCATISPSMISASTRFLAHPRLIIPTLTGSAGRRTSAADKGRLHDSMTPIRSIDDNITGVIRDKLPVFSHLYRPFVQDMHPESFSLNDDRPAVRAGKSVKYGLCPLFVLGDFNVRPSNYPDLQLLFRESRESGPNWRLGRSRRLRCARRQRPSDLNSASERRRSRICPHFLWLGGRLRGTRGRLLRRRLGRQRLQ